MLSQLQKRLNMLINGKGFVRRLNSDEAFFVSDAPRLLPPEEAKRLQLLLEANGFLCLPSTDGLWRIDLTDAVFQTLYSSYEEIGSSAVPAFPCLKSDEPVYELYRLLTVHPAPWNDQPKPPLRALAKADENTTELRRCARRLLPECAAMLRNHTPLPARGAALLGKALERN